MLITHGCALDKKNRRGEFTVQRFHFLPLHDVSSTDTNKQSELRNKAREIAPLSALYLGEVPTLGFEGFVVLSEPITVPAARFGLAGVDISDEQGNPMDTRLAEGSGWYDRVARLAPTHLQLFQDKMSAFWTGRRPKASTTAADTAAVQETTETGVEDGDSRAGRAADSDP